jgi:hypothetical protein
MTPLRESTHDRWSNRPGRRPLPIHNEDPFTTVHPVTDRAGVRTG